MQNSQRIELQCKQFSYSLKSILINTDNTTGSLKDLYNLIASPTGERKARLGQVQKIGFEVELASRPKFVLLVGFAAFV